LLETEEVVTALPRDSRRDVYEAAQAVVHGCEESDSILMLPEEARALEERFPGCGLTTRDIVDYMAAIAAEHGVPFALGWKSTAA